MRRFVGGLMVCLGAFLNSAVAIPHQNYWAGFASIILVGLGASLDGSYR